MFEYEVKIYELITHTVYVEAGDKDEAYDLAYNKIQSQEEDTIYDREYTGDYEVNLDE